MEKRCEICDKSFKPWPGRPGRYCSRKCASVGASRSTAEQRGQKLRDRGEGKSYRKLHGRHEHRVVGEQILGRPLLPGETVHHKNLDKRDNDPGNLVVLGSQGEHARLHKTHATPRLCEIEGCSERHYAKGMCRFHYHEEYNRMRRKGVGGQNA